MKKEKTGQLTSLPNQIKIGSTDNEFQQLKKRKKNSVRTSLQIAKGTDNFIKSLVKYYDATRKEIIDSLCQENFLELMITALWVENRNSGEKLLEDFKKEPLKRKTFVMSPGSKNNLTSIAKRYKISRDFLFDNRVRLEVTRMEKKAESYKKILVGIAEIKKLSEKLEKKTYDLLWKGDPLGERINYIIWMLDHLIQHVNDDIDGKAALDEEDKFPDHQMY